jgi:hypothetical protein
MLALCWESQAMWTVVSLPEIDVVTVGSGSPAIRTEMKGRLLRPEARLSIPSDMLPSVLQVLAAGRLKYLVMRGSKFRYRSARLVSFSLQTRLAEDDLMEETAS